MWFGTPLFPEQRIDHGRPRRRPVLLPARESQASSRPSDRRTDRVLRDQISARRHRTRSAPDCTAACGSKSAWTVIPLLISLVIFFWGATVFFAMSRPPDETLNVYVVGKQWMWKVQHPDGQREINELHVPVGRAGEADHDVRGRDSRLLRARRSASRRT